jgi:UPF0271 protein
MKVVLDTSAIIYLQDFRKFEEIYTTDSVIREAKDKISAMKTSAINIKIIEPSKKSVNEIENVAKKTGDLEKLSRTDIEVLALAKELKATIVSDDYSVQNVAKKIGVEFIPVFNKGIKELFTWKKFCLSCKKYLKNELNECPTCGSKLKRVPKKKIYTTLLFL